jgi:hypothetical protein
MEVEGPFGATIHVEASERVRGEFVDWFETPPNSAIRNDDYRFLGSRFQFGVRVMRDPIEVFAQLQDSLLYKVPDHAPGPGGSYFANTPRRTSKSPPCEMRGRTGRTPSPCPTSRRPLVASSTGTG